MCGIIGSIGDRNAASIVLEGLKLLEYRGYDNAGLATLEAGPRLGVRKVGEKELFRLERSCELNPLFGTAGIGHTRWATHGEPSVRNAHPHVSGESVAVVHNGIVENHDNLRAELSAEGFEFRSDTDTEVLPHLVERELRRGAGTLESAVAGALAYVEGAYALAVLSVRHQGEIVAACNSSPLVVGLGTDELYVASDELALTGLVDAVAHLKDGEIVTLKRNGSYSFRGASLEALSGRMEKPAAAQELHKGGHAHYMYKEILEQPQAVRNALAGRLRKGALVTFGGLSGDIEGRLRDVHRIVLVGCGTSLFAAMTGRPLIERLSGILCETEQAAEFSYRDPLLSSADAVVGISQSGETADTLKAMALAKERHALCLSVTNRVGSTLAKRTRLGMYLHAGPEVAVASTKAFTSQAAVLALFALRLAQLRERPVSEEFADGLRRLPELIAEALAREEEVRALAAQCVNAKRLIVIGRGAGVPLALEGALKVREVAYLDAHGLSAAELKHGTLALVEREVPVLALMPVREALRAKMSSNLEEVRARGGRVMELSAPPGTPEDLLPIALAPMVQLFAYHLGVMRGVDVDRPRNLAKSVTVE